MATPTRVVHIRRDVYDVYIGRAGHGMPGTFGNSFPARPGESRTEALQRFRDYFLARVANDAAFRAEVLALRGKVLGCFCAPNGGLHADDRYPICHGQIIAAWLDAQPEP